MTDQTGTGSSPIRNISDTARWVAFYRARETQRPNAVFRDPFAKALAGDCGREIAEGLQFAQQHEWAYVARTYLIDEFVHEQVVQRGIRLVVNLAAGLDTRQYRMQLPADLQWIEVDLPEILDYKQDILRNERPVCRLEQIRLDLSNVDARRELFAQLGNRAQKALILTEGLLIYLTPEEAGSLAADLAAPPSFRRWIIDLASPGLLRMLQDGMNQQLSAAGAPLKFGPAEGPGFFEPFGWKPLEVRSILKTAARLGRLSFGLRLAALLPESKGRQGSRPWSGICLLAKTDGGDR
jgi:methyltransferase (TIGR00027 family)